MRYRRDYNPVGNPLNTIAAILVGIVIMVGLFYVARFIMRLLWIVAPILFIASLIIDHRVFLGYLRRVRDLFSRNIWFGLGAAALSVLLFPLLSLFLFGTALFRRRMKDAQREAQDRREGELIDFEEIDNDPLELPRQQQMRTRRRDDTDYDRLFEE